LLSKSLVLVSGVELKKEVIFIQFAQKLGLVHLSKISMLKVSRKVALSSLEDMGHNDFISFLKEVFSDESEEIL
jgi:hypothetical protein